MSNISSCLDLMTDIDDQMFLAECNVMSAHNEWMSKISEMVEYYGGFDNIPEYVQEAEYGRRDTGGNKWLNKIRMFILRCIDKIVDAITNFLLKIKTRKAEYIRIPYKYEDLMEDINLVKSIDKDIYQIFDNVENFTSDDNIRKLTSIKEKLKNTHFAKKERMMISDKDPEAYNMNNKYGVKPDKYMILAKDLRNLNRALKDTKRRASKMVGDEWLKGSESTDKSRTTVTELLFNIYTEMSRMIVKLMRSFTVSGVEKMDKEIIEKKIKSIDFHIKNLRVTIDKPVTVNNSYYDDIDDDLEYFDETEKPYDAYLKNHNYDPKTNTIEIDGKHVNAGSIRSKKERNRINKFLRENDYDPKTETILTDIDDNGKKKRIKFVIDSSLKDNAFYDPEKDTITMGPHGKNTGISSKPPKSNQTLKHEEGHAAQYAKDSKPKHEYSESKHKSDNVPVSTSKADLHKFIDDNPVDGYDHYQDFELDADLYGYQHNRHASKDMKTKNGLSYDVKNDNKRIENINKSQKQIKDRLIDDAKMSVRSRVEQTLKIEKYDIERIIRDISELEEMLERSKKNGTLSTEDLHRFNDYFNTDVEDIHDPLSFTEVDPDTPVSIEDITKKLSEIKKHFEHTKNVIEKAEEDIKNISIDKFDDVDEYNKEVEKINQKVSQGIERAIENVGLRHKEIDARNKFLDQHADEAGSQARKLEGRQGKHKGKK